MADVFLSYARPDLDLARGVASDLEAEGYSVFFDQHIGVGENWDALIESEIEAAKCVVVLWSPVSRDREWVRNEARFGRQKGVLCPALVGQCIIPLEFNSMQTANLCERNAGDRQHAEWRRLMSAVLKLAGQPEAPKSQTTGAVVPGETVNQPYWRAFQPIAESHGRSRKHLKEVKSENFNTPLDRPSGFEVYASAYVIRSSNKRYGAYLWVWAQKPEAADSAMPVLESLKPALDQAMGESVIIERMSKHGIWISVHKLGDPDDRSLWPKQHGWMAERMAKLATAYRDIVAEKIAPLGGQ